MLSGKLDFSVMHYETPNEAIHYDLLAEDDFYLVMPLTLARKYQFPDYRTLSIYDLKALEQEPFLMVASRQKLWQTRFCPSSPSNPISAIPQKIWKQPNAWLLPVWGSPFSRILI